MNFEENLLQTKKYSQSHINIIYSMFVTLCDPNKESIYRSEFIIPFSEMSNLNNLKINEEFFDNYHIQIDYDKDGAINFQDFLRFIITHLNMMSRNLNFQNNTINSLDFIKSLGSKNDNLIFSNILNNIYFGKIMNYNTFLIVDLFQNNYLNIYTKYCNIINPKGNIIEKTSDFKLNSFNQMLNSLNNVNILNQISNNLNSFDINLLINTLNQFKTLLKPINYITSIYHVALNYQNIIQVLINLATFGVLQKILFLISSIGYNNVNGVLNFNTQIIYYLFKINKRILYLGNYIKKTFYYCNNEKCKYLYNYVKKNINDTLNFLNFLNENLIPQTILKLNFSLETYNNFNIEHVTYQIILEISKYSLEKFENALTNTHYLNWLSTKANILYSNLNILDLNINTLTNNSNTNIIIGFQNGIISLNHLFFNCINLLECILFYKFESENSIKINKLVINTCNNIINGFQDIFFKLNNILSQLNPNNNNEFYYLHQSMYIILISLFSFIGNFEDRIFILKFIESKILLNKKNIFIRPLNFYLKCLLINQKDILSLISELKILNIFSEYYLNENIQEISEFFDLINIIVESYLSYLNSSNIVRDIVLIFNSYFPKTQDNNTKNLMIEILYKLSSINDIIINDLCSDSTLISNIISYISENWIVENNFSKGNDKKFETILLYNGCMFFYNLVNSENNKGVKFLSKISNQNIQYLYELGLSLCILSTSDSYLKNLNETELQYKNFCSFYKKYKKLPQNNILTIIIKILENLSNSYSNNNEDIFINISEYINNCIINLKIKLRDCGVFNIENLQENGSLKKSEMFIDIKPIPILKFFTQNLIEKNNDRCSFFEYSFEKLDYNNFIESIKNNYKSDIDLYLILEDRNIKIKDENDFLNMLKKIFDSYNKSEGIKESIIVKFFVVEKKLISKSILNCINCGKKIEIEKKTSLNDLNLTIENLKDDSVNLCNECKNMFLKQIENQITLSRTLNLNNTIKVDSKKIIPNSVLNNSTLNFSNVNNMTNPYSTPSTKQLFFNQISDIKKLNTSSNDFLTSACPIRVLSKTIFENKDENDE